MEDELNQISLKVGRDLLVDLRTTVWDGAGLTLEEVAEQGLDNVIWRDMGMTLPELIEFMGDE